VCPDTGAIYNLGMQISPPFTLAAMRISPESKTVEQIGTVKLPEMAYVHDNVLTAEYLAFVTPPYVAQQSDLLKSMLGGAPVGKQFK
jgi:carotenoid cleavage dioxygenase-like enzyme